MGKGSHTSELQRSRINKHWGGLEGKKKRFIARSRKDVSGCTIWEGAYTGNSPYGACKSLKGQHTTAHRVAYELFVGDIPDEMQCLHKCDNPKCVNVDHLFLGTQMDNMHDMIAKGRQAIGSQLNHKSQTGELNYNAKLTEDDVRDIRKMYDNGESIASISRLLNVPSHNTGLVARRKTWKHVK